MEPYVSFINANTELSIQFRKANTEPSMAFRNANMKPLCILGGTTQHFLSIARQESPLICHPIWAICKQVQAFG